MSRIQHEAHVMTSAWWGAGCSGRNAWILRSAQNDTFIECADMLSIIS